MNRASQPFYRELKFENPGQALDLAFLGGSPYLSVGSAWPCETSGKAMLHLASLPASFIQTHVPQVNIKANLCISIFTPYDVRDDAYIETALQAGGRVIAHLPSDHSVSSAKHAFTPRLISTEAIPAPDSADNGIAKIGGIPAWLQEHSAEGEEFILQINSSRLNRAAPTHRGILVGGMGYLLLDRNIPSPSTDCGRFVIQTT